LQLNSEEIVALKIQLDLTKGRTFPLDKCKGSNPPRSTFFCGVQ